MKARLPRVAGRILDDATLCYLAVRTARGPHLTPVVYAVDGGRVWLTTSRNSVKARVLRRDREVAGLVREGDVAVAFRGRARTYDALDPLSWPFAAVAGPRLVRAATRFSVKNARFFAGYAVDAGRVPLAWMPPGRVFIGIEPVSGALLDLADGAVTDSWGDWETDPVRIPYRRSYSALPARRALDLGVPRQVRSAVGAHGEGALAVGKREPIVIPVLWRRAAGEGAYDVALPNAFLRLAEPAPGLGGRDGLGWAGLTVDRLASWRASEMTGLLIQGPAQAFSPSSTSKGSRALRDRLEAVLAGATRLKQTVENRRERLEDFALVRLRPRRVVWWRGWSSGVITEPE